MIPLYKQGKYADNDKRMLSKQKKKEATIKKPAPDFNNLELYQLTNELLLGDPSKMMAIFFVCFLHPALPFLGDVPIHLHKAQ